MRMPPSFSTSDGFPNPSWKEANQYAEYALKENGTMPRASRRAADASNAARFHAEASGGVTIFLL